MKDTKGLRVVLPDGSMEEKAKSWFAGAGLPITMAGSRTKEGLVSADWIGALMFQRPQEISDYVAAGFFDIGITGQDWLRNSGHRLPELLEIPAGRQGNKPVQIVLAVREDSGWREVYDLPAGCTVATEYVELTRQWFSRFDGKNPQIIRSWGNTEHKIQFGADAIVDVTETGRSLKENGLRIIATLVESNIVVVANPKAYEDEEKGERIDLLVRLIAGGLRAAQYVWIVANVPLGQKEMASKVLGGLKAPTCSGLAYEPNWVSLSAAVPAEKEIETILALNRLGVKDIIVNRNLGNIMA